MKIPHLLAAAALTLGAGLASALDIQPYSPERFSQLQQTDAPVTLHFHADWCPTCRAQEKVLKGWKNDATVPGTLLVVNYDNEKDLRKQMGVRGQSTLIAFHGTTEKGRLAGDTSPAALRALLEKAAN